jgi:RNA polymerase sigma-70 factor (ECF subfamily)
MVSITRTLRAIPPERAEPTICLVATPPPFASVYDRYFDFVWASVRRLGVGEGDVDDVVQEVFVVIHARLHTLSQPESVRSWVYGVVRRTVSGYRRTRRSEGTTDAALAELDRARESSQATPQSLKERSDRVDLLWALLAELDQAKREIFVLAEVEEMTAPEIASALEIPLNTVYSRLRAARQAFDAALARHEARVAFKGGA